jgi:hypothetical protein
VLRCMGTTQSIYCRNDTQVTHISTDIALWTYVDLGCFYSCDYRATLKSVTFFLQDRYIITEILDAFAEFCKAAISFVVSVFPSAWNNSAPTGRILMKLGI